MSEGDKMERTKTQNIVDVIGGHTHLNATERDGEFYANCPFCNATGSLVVSSRCQVYLCWECKSAGGVLNFIKDAFGVDLDTAVELLAKQKYKPREVH